MRLLKWGRLKLANGLAILRQIYGLGYVAAVRAVRSESRDFSYLLGMFSIYRVASN